MTCAVVREPVDVAIVGAGLCGLAAAYRLLQAGLSVRVLEASARAGGRIDSCHADGEYLGDLGPSWCWPSYQPVADGWLQELGIALQPQYVDGLGVIERDQNQPIMRHALPGQHGISRLRGGPQAIVDALLQRVGPQRILFDHPVSAVSLEADQLILKSDTVSQLIAARHVVVAVPPRLVVQQIAFAPSLDAQRVQLMARAPTWMAAQAKVVIHYATAFWRQQGLSGRVASQVGPLPEVHDHSGPNGEPAALFGFVGWPVEARSRAPLTAAIVDQLVRCFGRQAARPRSIHLRDWAQQRWICSDADRSGPAAHPSVLPALLRQPEWGGRLHFAGAETSTLSPGLIEGALHAADAVASAITQH